MKRPIVAVAALAFLAGAISVPRPTRWSWLASLPLLPWERATVDACAPAEPALLRKLVQRSEDVGCLPEWWTLGEVEEPAAHGAWFAARAIDGELRVRDHWRAALVAQSVEVAPEPVVWTRAASFRSQDRFARAVLWDGRERFGDALDPASAVAADLSRWVADAVQPENPGLGVRWVTLGWMEQDGLGHVARAYVGRRGETHRAVEPHRRVYVGTDSPSLQEACERAESPDCLTALARALETDGEDTLPLSPLARSWSESRDVDPVAVEELAEVWRRWGQVTAAEHIGPVLRALLDSAGASTGGDVFSLDPGMTRGPWTAALSAVWLGRHLGRRVDVLRRPGEVGVLLDGVEVRRGDCGVPARGEPSSARVVHDQEIMARAAWEHRAEPVMASVAARLGGTPMPEGVGVAATLAEMIRPPVDTKPLDWQECP